MLKFTMVKEILQIGNPILNQKSSSVTDFRDPELLTLIEDLLDTCKSKREITAGLASPQIGGKLAVCICRRVDLEDEHGKNNVAEDKLWEVLINPEIVETSNKQSVIWEACLSIGEAGEMLHGPVSRPKNVTVSYFKPDGSKGELSGGGFFSHLIQHEYDHLQGTLFLKYVTNPANIWREKDLNEYLEKYETYPDIQ